jgi:tetratricopeptide (TPR) repeat protein/CHAT domain-containing protein
VAILATGGCGMQCDARPAPSPGARAALDEATQLDQQARALANAGGLREALPPAERSLSLRERALGAADPGIIISLNNLASLYLALSAYKKAELLYARAITLGQREGKPDDLATSLQGLAAVHRAQGAYANAEPLYLRALGIREQLHGPAHPDIARTLVELASLYQAEGAYAKAKPLYVHALAMYERLRVPMHLDVARALVALASLHQAQGAYAEAESLYVRALGICEREEPPSPLALADALGHLAALYHAQGALEKAEPLYVRALDVLEKSAGPRRPEVATALNNLATLYQAQGSYAKAEPLFRRAVALQEEVLGPGHVDLASSMNNLGMLYAARGDSRTAESLYLRALRISEQALGASHPAVISNLNILGAFYQAQGAYAEAEPMYRRALSISLDALGGSHPEVANDLNRLAELYRAQGAYAKAEPLYGRSLEIVEKNLGPWHPEVADRLSSLASLYRAQGAHERALPLLVRALDIRKKALGAGHPEVARTLSDLARAFHDQRAYGRAEPLLQEAIDIRTRALGPGHPAVANALTNLATIYEAQGAPARAEPLLSRAAEIREDQLRMGDRELGGQGPSGRGGDAQQSVARSGVGDQPPAPATAPMASIQAETDRLVSLHVHTMPRSRPALELAVTAVLRRKGRMLDLDIGDTSAWTDALDATLRGRLAELASARHELVTLHHGHGGARAADRTAMAAVRARIDDLESSLRTASAEFRVQSEPVTMAKIQAVLPREAALVEFVRYCRFDARQAQPWRDDHYVAYLLMAHGPPQWVALGPAAPIDAEVDHVLVAIHDHSSVETTRAALQHLDNLVFAPIRPLLSGVQQVIFAPDGRLNLLPFEALVDRDGKYLLDRYLVSYVTTGRDLLRFSTPHPPRSSAVIVAEPAYGPLPSPKSAALSFAPRAEALAEALALKVYFPQPPVTGERATKSALASLTGPAMLHVATYGFYARDLATPPGSAPVGSSGSANGMLAQPPAQGNPVTEGDSWLLPPPRFEDPVDGLDRAGLAMAGANQGVRGIATAREIAHFNWSGTQLVVLTACEMPSSAARSADGVYGLRRALVLAGAESHIISLWTVSGPAAKKLMFEYYGALARGGGRAEALRQVKLQLMREPGYLHPYYWAAFLPGGDWRPLDKTTLPRSGAGP